MTPVETLRETTTTTAAETPGAPLGLLGVACAVGVSSIYLNQPLLAEMGSTFHARPESVGYVAVATQVGYACGLLTFVPLGDVLPRRALMLKLYGAAACALLLVALAPSLPWMIAASVLVGLFASVTHIALPIAPDLVPDHERGRAIGTVMTGLLLGVLLARTFAGWISHIHGWVWVFVAAAVLNGAFVPLLYRSMPRLPPRQQLTWPQAMRSLWGLWRGEPLLREAAIVGALVFAAFSSFWTTLAFLLQTHYGLGPGIAGSFGVVGAAGALCARPAGRLADRHGTRWVVTFGLAVLGGSFGVLWLAVALHVSLAVHLVLLVAGVLALDVGAQMTQVANQTRIFGLNPDARSRLNTVYMVTYFTGAALGSWLSSQVWARFGWAGVMLLALGFMALAALRHVTGVRAAVQVLALDHYEAG